MLFNLSLEVFPSSYEIIARAGWVCIMLNGGVLIKICKAVLYQYSPLFLLLNVVAPEIRLDTTICPVYLSIYLMEGCASLGYSAMEETKFHQKDY